jgi:apolipoprotein N-acyltransferase
VVQVATSGKSAIIDPDGRTVAQSGALFTPAILVSAVPLGTSTTLATRTGAGTEWLLVALGLLALLAGARPWSRRRSTAAVKHQTETSEPAGVAVGVTGEGRG